MTTLNSPNYVADWLKSESPIGNYYSRDQITLASGHGVLVTGTVLAQVTASGKYVPAVASASDGSQTAVAILIDQSADTTADKAAVALRRSAEVMAQGLTYDTSINSPTLRAAVAAQLQAAGIIVRQGA